MKALCRILVLVAALAVLNGCGPGVGGTGTGATPPELALFGATAQPVCGAPFADRLDCAAGTGGAATPSADGTAPRHYVDAATGARIVVLFDANRIELDDRCTFLRFTGVWAGTPDGDARYFGSTSSGVPASLAVTAVPDGLQLLLRAADGSAVLGPVLAVPVPAPRPGPCP